jgi:hypothetical protein
MEKKINFLEIPSKTTPKILSGKMEEKKSSIKSTKMA